MATFQVLGASKKRRVDASLDDEAKENMNGLQCYPRLPEPPPAPPPTRHFLRLPGSGCVYESEEWKPGNTTLYVPLSVDVMINLRSTEQLSFASGAFFIADEQGVYKHTQQGFVINLWRYSEQQRKLYISRSILITDAQVYEHVRQQLEKV